MKPEPIWTIIVWDKSPEYRLVLTIVGEGRRLTLNSTWHTHELNQHLFPHIIFMQQRVNELMNSSYSSEQSNY